MGLAQPLLHTHLPRDNPRPDLRRTRTRRPQPRRLRRRVDRLGSPLEIETPVDGSHIGSVRQVTRDEYDGIVDRAHEAYMEWHTVPATHRGEAIRQLGNRPRVKNESLGSCNARDEQDPGRGEGRGAVDDRHLRLRGRTVAPALRAHASLRRGIRTPMRTPTTPSIIACPEMTAPVAGV